MRAGPLATIGSRTHTETIVYFQEEIFMTSGSFVWVERILAVSGRACTREVLSYVKLCQINKKLVILTHNSATPS